DRDGYVVLRATAKAAVRPLRRLHHRLVGSAPDSFHSTLYTADRDLKQEVDRQIFEVMEPIIGTFLVDHQPLLANYVTKGRDPEATMPPHQDWTFVDEHAGASYNVWVPLVDVDHRSGAISVLPGGHRIPFTIRGTETPNAFADIEDEAARRMVELPMRAGDVLVHDHRMLHASPPNRRRRPRLAVACALIGADARPIHFRQRGEGEVERFAIERDFFTEHTFGADLPPCAVATGTVAFAQPALTTEDLALLASDDDA
ncbi:MAG: phytanoyl-CoA dioxygenase family protein, partial [Acidimicrobiales bacterium]|nr:phytanoyl-CoA dioxygenase family protein [Acidimicrobiales bacterium]